MMSTPPGSTWYTQVVAGAIFALGPVLGPFSLLLFASFAGALLALGKAEVADRMAGFFHLVTSMFVALVLTSACVWAVTNFTSVPADVALMPVAFFLAAGRPFILDLVQKVFGALGDMIASIFAKMASIFTKKG